MELNNAELKSMKYLASLVFTILFMLRFIGGIPMPSQVLVIGLTILFVLYSSINGIIIYKPFLIFISYIGLSLLLANPDPVFHAWERFILFISLLLLVSPLIQNERLRRFRKQCLNLVLILSIIISLISFVFYFLGINLMESEYMDPDFSYYDAGGTFGGLTKHSMLLGPLCGVSIITLIYIYFKKKKKSTLLYLLPCIGCLFFAASRGSVVATVMGVLSLLYVISNSKLIFIRRLLLSVIFLFASYPLGIM